MRNLTNLIKQQFGDTSLVKNVGWLLGEKSIRLLLSLIVNMLLARYLGPDDFGLLSLCLTFFVVISVLSSYGMEAYLVNQFVISPSSKNELIGSALTIRALISILLISLLVLGTYVTSSDERFFKLVVIICIAVFFKTFDVIDYYFQSVTQIKYISLARNVALLLASFFRIIFVINDYPLFYLGLTYPLEYLVVAFLLGLFYLRKKDGTFRLIVKRSRVKQIMNHCLPLVLSSFTVMIYQKSDIFMIAYLLDKTQVAYYSVAARLSEAWYFIPMSIISVAFPRILKFKVTNSSIYNKQFQRLMGILIIIGLIAAIITSLISDVVINILYGYEYLTSSIVLRIHIWGGIFVAMGVISGRYFLSDNKRTYLFIRTLVGAVLNIVLNVILIPTYGILGAASATLISQFVSAFAIDAILDSTRKMFFMKIRAIVFK